MSFEIKEGAFIYINGQPIVFPRDSNFYPVSFIFALTEDGNQLVPVRVTPDGKLLINISGVTVELGAVEIRDPETNRKLDIVLSDDTGTNIRGLLFYGINEENKVRPFLFDLNNRLLVTDKDLEQLLTNVKEVVLDIDNRVTVIYEDFKQLLTNIREVGLDIDNRVTIIYEDFKQLLTDIKELISGSLTTGVINRNENGEIESIITTDKLLNRTVKLTFTRNNEGEIISWDEVIL